MQELRNSKVDNAYRILMKAVIERAMLDLEGKGLKSTSNEKEKAMAFILSDTCEGWCLEVMLDYERIKKKSIEFYKLFLEKIERIETEKAEKKRARKPVKRFKGIWTRQRPTKRRSITYN